MERETPQSVVLYGYIRDELASGGICSSDLAKMNDMPMGHGSVRSFIEANLQAGHFEWRNQDGEKVLVNANRALGLKLTKDEEQLLNSVANEKGITVQECATNIVLNAISSQK